MAIRIMTKVWDDGPDDRNETMVLLALADHANDEGYCYPGLDRLQQRCRLSRQGLCNIIDRLEQKGWIKKKSGGQGPGTPNEYWIQLSRFERSDKGQAGSKKGQAGKEKGSSWLDSNHQGTIKEPSGKHARVKESDSEPIAAFVEVLGRRPTNYEADRIRQHVTGAYSLFRQACQESMDNVGGDGDRVALGILFKQYDALVQRQNRKQKKTTTFSGLGSGMTDFSEMIRQEQEATDG